MRTNTILKNALFAKSGEEFAPVALPHTWNAQNYNHPSICFWGLANEITIRGDSEELLQNLRDLNALCKTIRSLRMGMARYHMVSG